MRAHKSERARPYIHSLECEYNLITHGLPHAIRVHVVVWERAVPAGSTDSHNVGY